SRAEQPGRPPPAIRWTPPRRSPARPGWGAGDAPSPGRGSPPPARWRPRPGRSPRSPQPPPCAPPGSRRTRVRRPASARPWPAPVVHHQAALGSGLEAGRLQAGEVGPAAVGKEDRIRLEALQARPPELEDDPALLQEQLEISGQVGVLARQESILLRDHRHL